MANSIKVTTKLEWLEDSTLTRTIPAKTTTVATTSGLIQDVTQVVGTTHELVSAGDVTDDAMLIVENLHATALVQLGIDDGGSFVPVIDIPALYPRCVIPVASTLASLYIKSSSASTSVRVSLYKIA